MAFLSRGSARIYYETFDAVSRAGRGWVTLVNGHARSSTDFRAFAKHLSENDFSVLTFDNRGCGQTESPPFMFQDMLGDVIALWDDLEIKQTHLLGISYGGVISLNLAATHGPRIRSLVLASTTCQSRHLGGRRLAELPLAEREAEMAQYFGPAFGEKNPVLFRSLVKQMARVFDDENFVARARQQRSALDQFDFRDKLVKIRCPTLVIHGKDDRVIAPVSAEELQHSIPGSSIELWDDIGHLFLAESPRRFYETCTQFFSAHSR